MYSVSDRRNQRSIGGDASTFEERFKVAEKYVDSLSGQDLGSLESGEVTSSLALAFRLKSEKNLPQDDMNALMRAAGKNDSVSEALRDALVSVLGGERTGLEM